MADQLDPSEEAGVHLNESAPDETLADYTANTLQVLKGLEAVRKRPAMYIGSTSSRGLHHLFIEVLDNSIDEALQGFCDLIDVVIHQDGSLSVTDNGRGIPTDIHQETGLPGVTLALTELHAGGKFGGGAYKVSGGLHGVGVSCVNALSVKLEVIVKQYGKIYRQTFERGDPTSSLEVIGETKNEKQTGTLVRFWPDPEIFETIVWNAEYVRQRIMELSFLNKEVTLTFLNELATEEESSQNEAATDEAKPPRKESFHHEKGIGSFVEYMNRNKDPLHKAIYFTRQREAVEVEIALQYNDSYQENIHSYANNIHTADGGTHVSGFKSALTRVINNYAKKSGMLKEKDAPFQGDDVREGIMAVISCRLPNPQFEGQTKGKLGNSEMEGIVNSIVTEGLTECLEENPAIAKKIIDKATTASRAREAARRAADLVKRQSALESSSLPGKLADCSESDPSKCELFLVEGDSAGGCFSGDTTVALADGRDLTFREIVDEQAKGIEHFVYTIRRDGKIGLERAIHARMTKRDAEVVRVVFDDGESVVCTPDHRFMLRDGVYKAAKDLQPSDALMPLYRKLSTTADSGITISGYEMVWDVRSDRWLFTHMLADWHNRWSGVYKETDGDHCHHIDFNKRNNNPTNLRRMPSGEHLALHRDHVGRTLHQAEVIEKCRALRRTDEFRSRMSQRMKRPDTRAVMSDQAREQWTDPKYKSYMIERWRQFCEANPDYVEANRQRLDEIQREYWSSEEHRSAQADRVRQRFADHPEQRQEMSDAAKTQWRDERLLDWRRKTTSDQWTEKFRAKRKIALDRTYYQKTMTVLKTIEREKGVVDVDEYESRRRQTHDHSILSYQTFCERYFNGNAEKAVEAVIHHNHRVASVERLVERIDVYDLETPVTHNFALGCGVFVHNSAKQGRDRKYQAVLPLRGKVLNVEKVRIDRALDNAEIRSLIMALGTGVSHQVHGDNGDGDSDDGLGQIPIDLDAEEATELDAAEVEERAKPNGNGHSNGNGHANGNGKEKERGQFNLGKLRYDRIIIMTDADVDGAHIRTLLLTFFFRYMRPLIEEGHIYIARPPLYVIKIGTKEKRYAYGDKELNQIMKEVKSRNVTVGRFKGLGEMNAEELADTTMDVSARTILKVEIDDAAMADDIFTTLMGEKVQPRKEFIEAHGREALAIELDI